MRIYDLVENTLTENTDEELLMGLLKRFRDNKRTDYSNATHKFNSVRKAYANELDDKEQQSQVMKISAAEFFNYMKSQKKPNSATSKPETTTTSDSKERPELVPPTMDDLNKSTTDGVISAWVRKYGDHYTNEELYDVLYNQSPVGKFEDPVYVRSAITRARTGIDIAKREELRKKHYPEMQQKFRNSLASVKSLKGSKDYEDVLKDFVYEVRNQPRTPGYQPQKLHQMFKYLKNKLYQRYDAQAFAAFTEGQDDEKVQSLINKRDITKHVRQDEIANYMAS